MGAAAYYDKVRRMSVTADFGVGSSGAPIFNDRGGVVGMVATTHPIYVDPKCKQEYAQMIIKNCVTAEAILELVGGKAQQKAK